VVAADTIVVDSLASLGESNVYDAADSNQNVPEIIQKIQQPKGFVVHLFIAFYQDLQHC
jgi:hypothetical protein